MTGVDGTRLKVRGIALIEIKINNKAVSHPFRVVEFDGTPSFEIILGIDLLRKCGLKIQLTEFNLNINSIAKQSNHTLFTPEEISLSPYQGATIKIPLKPVPKEGEKGRGALLIEPSGCSDKIRMRPTLISWNAPVIVTIENPTSESVVIPARTEIAKILTGFQILNTNVPPNKRQVTCSRENRSSEVTPKDFDLSHLSSENAKKIRERSPVD